VPHSIMKRVLGDCECWPHLNSVRIGYDGNSTTIATRPMIIFSKIKKYIVMVIALSASLSIAEIELYTEFPSEIIPGERYVIYSHGLIVEGENSRPEHPKFGTYEFVKIKEAIFYRGGFNLIAHHRPENTNIAEYVKKLESWVHRLVDSGVKPSKITLVGFSRGSHLTAFASDKLSALGINTALLASCMDGDIPTKPPLSLSGNLLSVYETSDVMGTCEKLANQSTLKSFREISISTGLTHGAFFLPLPEWIVPLKEWIHETNR